LVAICTIYINFNFLKANVSWCILICNVRQRLVEAIAVAPVTAAAVAAAASFQVGLCNSMFASLLPSLFSICHVRLG